MVKQNNCSNKQKRQRLSKKVASIVAPDGMSYSQYLIACTANGVTPSLENGPYLHWLICGAIDAPSIMSSKVVSCLCKGLEEGWLLDENDNVQQSYFLDACVDVSCSDRELNKRLYNSFFIGYKNSASIGIWKQMKKLNNVFAFDILHTDASAC